MNIKKRKKRPYILLLAIILVVVGVAISARFYYIKLYHSRHVPVVTASESTKGETPSISANLNSTTNTEPGDTKSSTGGNTTTDNSSNNLLISPSGNFVSNHHPNLSSSPAPNTMQSVCNTTPGATCQISFSSGTEVRSLAAQTTDRGGATYWNWKLQDIGLTQGSWQIIATATQGSQTKTTTDALPLEVGQ